MGGFFGWFLVIVGVLAIFNAEKLPALRAMLEEKFKGSLDVAKEVSKTTKNKIEKEKNAPQEIKEPEENTPEETEEALNFMSNYITKKEEETPTTVPEQTEKEPETTEDTPQEDKPIDLNKFD